MEFSRIFRHPLHRELSRGFNAKFSSNLVIYYLKNNDFKCFSRNSFRMFAVCNADIFLYFSHEFNWKFSKHLTKNYS